MTGVKVGSPARGEDFFDREQEQRRLWQHLETDHVLLLAPRRVGKTSLMLKLADDASRKGFIASYLTVESATDEIGFVGRMLDAMRALGSKRGFQRLLEKLRYLLDVLPSDGYLVDVDGRYRFRSSMLRDFWLHRFGPGKPGGSGADPESGR